MQPASKRLKKMHEQVPWPELTAMCIPRNLYIEASARGGRRRTWFMREQYFCPRIGWRTAQRRRGIALLSGIEVVRADVRHTGEYQRRSVVHQHYMFILENLESEAPDFLGPCALTGVVLVISGHEVNAVPRHQAGKRRRVSR